MFSKLQRNVLSKLRKVCGDFLHPVGYTKVAAAGYRLYTGSLVNPVQFKSPRVILTLERKKSFNFWIHLFWHAVGTLTMLIHLIAIAWRAYVEWEQSAVWQQSMFVLFVYVFAGCLVLLWVYVWRQEEMKDSMATSFAIEEMVQNEGFRNYIDRGILLVLSSTMSVKLAMPIGFLIMTPVIPCFPPLVGFVGVTCSSRWKNLTPIQPLSPGWILLSIFEAYMGLVILQVMCWTVNHACYAMASSMAYLKTICRSSVKDPYPSRAFRVYRVLALHIQLLNRVIEDPFISMGLLGLVLGETVALFVLIGSYDVVPKVTAAFFVMIAVQLFLVLNVGCRYCYYVAAQSEEFLRNLNHTIGSHCQRRDSKWSRKVAKSLLPLAVTMGFGQVFDQISSAALTQIAVDQLVNLLLL